MKSAKVQTAKEDRPTKVIDDTLFYFNKVQKIKYWGSFDRKTDLYSCRGPHVQTWPYFTITRGQNVDLLSV